MKQQYIEGEYNNGWLETQNNHHQLLHLLFFGDYNCYLAIILILLKITSKLI